jgi:hypothetical protein
MIAQPSPAVTGAHRRTLDAIFRHPSAHNLEWSDLVGLIEAIGGVEPKGGNEFAFEVAGERHIMRKPHTKDLTGPDVLDVRRFLQHAGWSPDRAPAAAVDSAAPPPSLLVVIDHHEAKIYHIDVASDDASMHVIKPYDPHHFLHHLTHKDQDREQGQRAPEEASYYERIAEAVATGGRIVLVGHGAGKSNAAHHLTEYLRKHHRETYLRIAHAFVADLSSITTPELLELAAQGLR